jgi:hypothetical protein
LNFLLDGWKNGGLVCLEWFLRGDYLNIFLFIPVNNKVYIEIVDNCSVATPQSAIKGKQALIVLFILMDGEGIMV